MRNQISLIIMQVMLFQLAAQQTDRLSFGVKLSPSINWINAEHNDVQSDGATANFGMGGVVNYRLSSSVSFVTGLNYNGFGGYVFDNESLNNTITRNNYQLNYSQIEIPIALKLQTNKVNKISYYLQGGASIGFITNANEKRLPLTKNTDPIYNDIMSLTYPSRLAFQLGAGVEYSIGKRSVLFGQVNYNNSLSNSANSESYVNIGRYSSPLQLLPGSMEFSVGFMF